ncbi:MAG: hypothetical protein A2017_18540 [Lentisphaerae bacterium GWF2_44_16]|nr:MAG: hypothetical protein A2017_18540 [Lentisphaerae bacterium GWF2_44_16]
MSSKKITIADIAKKLDISPTTVSFVLNGRDSGISQDTKNKVLETAKAMGYKKSFLPSIPDDWTKVAYVTSKVEYFNFYTSFFAHVYNNLQKRAQQEKFDLFLLELNPHEGYMNCHRRIEEIRSLGIEVCLSNSKDVAACLVAAGFKCILAQGGSMADCICIYCDDYAAGREAALHALEMGHKKAGMIFFSDNNNPRFKGFLETFTANGGTCDKKHIWFASSNHDEAASHIEKMASSSEKLPSLFYCFADNLLFPALKGFSRAGFRTPDDISLIGTDNLYWGSVATPAFTTVDLCEELFAEKLITAITHTKEGKVPYQLAVPVKLIPRETVKKIKN